MTAGDQERKAETGLPCVACNYDLRGCEMADRCPECGIPVSRSQHGLLLQYSDARWLRRIHKGLTLLLWWAYLSPAFLLLVIVIALSKAALPSQWWVGVPSIKTGWSSPALWLAWHGHCCLGVLGFVLLTAQEPRVQFEEGLLTCRRGLRLWALFCSPMIVEHCCLGFAAMGMPLLPREWRSVLIGVCTIGGVALVGKLLSELSLLRMGNPELAARVRGVSKGLIRAILAATVLSLIMSFAAKDGVVETVCSLVYLAAGLACLAYAISYLSIVRECRSSIGSAIAKAESGMSGAG